MTNNLFSRAQVFALLQPPYLLSILCCAGTSNQPDLHLGLEWIDSNCTTTRTRRTRVAFWLVGRSQVTTRLYVIPCFKNPFSLAIPVRPSTILTARDQESLNQSLFFYQEVAAPCYPSREVCQRARWFCRPHVRVVGMYIYIYII
jgi:hypothetical protein